MPTQDTTPIKESMLEFLRTNGPSLPVQISRHIKMDTIFGSAFLSELLSQKRIKITNMKVGGSPIYYIEGTEEKLEKYAQEYLKSKEKDAFILLQKKKFLIDSEQEPAIRVALRAIKDFAKPFEKENKVIWKYYLTKEKFEEKEIQQSKIISEQSELIEKEENSEPQMEVEKKDNQIEKPKEEIQHSVPQSIISNIQKEFEKNQSKEEIPLKEENNIIQKKLIKKKTATKTKAQDKKNERFFNTVKEAITKKQIEIIDIMGFSKGDLTLKIKEKDKEKILIAYNKKRLTELDITNAYKKAKEHEMEYIIFTLGEPAKKTTNFIEAIKNLSSIEKIE